MRKPTLSVQTLEASGFERIGCWSINEDRIICEDALPTKPGVYAFSIDGQVMYVGLASGSVAKRMYFYGMPSPTQRTNIRLNELIRQATNEGRTVEIHIAHPSDTIWNGLPVSGPQGLEAGIIKKFDLPWNMTSSGRGVIPKRNKVQTASPSSLYDRVYELVRNRPGLTEVEIANIMFGKEGYQQKVNPICRRLLAEGRVVRRGNGYQNDPYRYFVGTL